MKEKENKNIISEPEMYVHIDGVDQKRKKKEIEINDTYATHKGKIFTRLFQ